MRDDGAHYAVRMGPGDGKLGVALDERTPVVASAAGWAGLGQRLIVTDSFGHKASSQHSRGDKVVAILLTTKPRVPAQPQGVEQDRVVVNAEPYDVARAG